MMQYVPDPIDTSNVELPEELLGLTEQMARNVHEVWTMTRIEQGWRYGECPQTPSMPRALRRPA